MCRISKILFIGAVVFLIAALVLFSMQFREDRMAGQASEEVMNSLTNLESDADDKERGTIEVENNTEGVVYVDGYDYIGYLTIPAIDRQLPVMDRWDYERLKVASCRHFGSVAEQNLVIAAHNYDKHFGKLKELQVGDDVFFTDLDYQQLRYRVEEVRVIEPEQVDLVKNSDYELVLYTCTIGGKHRVAVFCSQLVA